MPQTQVQVDKAKFDNLLQKMLKTPPLTLKEMRKENAQKRGKK
jgi:hypothetical protein